MEFKGTKGKWKLANNDYGYYTSVRNSDDTRKICVSRVNNMTESNANMLLISKAPEMLEMLIEISRRINILKTEPNGIVRDTMIYNIDIDINIEHLIKEATEL